MITLKRAASQLICRISRFVGLSTDTKPLKGDDPFYALPHNGDEFFEMDTSTTLYYDEENNQWV